MPQEIANSSSERVVLRAPPRNDLLWGVGRDIKNGGNEKHDRSILLIVIHKAPSHSGRSQKRKLLGVENSRDVSVARRYRVELVILESRAQLTSGQQNK